MDGDKENQIDKQALGEACEAQAEAQQFETKLNGLHYPSERWSQYTVLKYRALGRQYEKALQAFPELRPEKENLDRARDESRKLLEDMTTDWDSWNSEAKRKPWRRADDEHMKKNRQYLEHIETLLKRFCSPPGV
ncbi:hypothetical protein [Bradyrhizobium sp.]